MILPSQENQVLYFSDNDPHRELAGLGFERLAPSPPLRDLIQCYWGARAWLAAPRVENLYPDGGWGLSFSFGNPPLSPTAASPAGTLDGVTSQRQELALTGAVDLFGARFQPGAAGWLIGTELPDVRDRIVSLDDLGGIWGKLWDRLSGAASTAERASLFEDNLFQRIALPVPGLLEQARSLVLRSDGMVPINKVAAHLGVSQRQLERTFQSQIGLPPKTLARLARIRRARLTLKLVPDRQLVDIALETGYFDQAHFTRDFRKVVGMTPGQYRRRALRRNKPGSQASCETRQPAGQCANISD